MEFQIIRCWQPTCAATFQTLNELSTHHVDAHERLLPPDVLTRPAWAPQPPAQRFRPPNHKAQAARAWHANGTEAPAGTPAGQEAPRHA